MVDSAIRYRQQVCIEVFPNMVLSKAAVMAVAMAVTVAVRINF